MELCSCETKESRCLESSYLERNMFLQERLSEERGSLSTLIFLLNNVKVKVKAFYFWGVNLPTTQNDITGGLTEHITPACACAKPQINVRILCQGCSSAREI